MSAIEFNQLRTQLRCTVSIIDKFDRRKYRFSDFICSCRRQLFLGRENRPATNRNDGIHHTKWKSYAHSVMIMTAGNKAWLTPLWWTGHFVVALQAMRAPHTHQHQHTIRMWVNSMCDRACFLFSCNIQKHIYVSVCEKCLGIEIDALTPYAHRN